MLQFDLPVLASARPEQDHPANKQKPKPEGRTVTGNEWKIGGF